MFDFLQRLSPRLHRQIEFLLTLDRLKNVERRTWVTGQDRRENSAEHSWHVAVAALVLSEYASSAEINLEKVIQMLLLHDIVEIEAGIRFYTMNIRTRTRSPASKRQPVVCFPCCLRIKRLLFGPSGRNSKPVRHLRPNLPPQSIEYFRFL